MLKAFFEYRLDRDGKPVDNRHYFENLMVSQNAEAMAQLGAFPVIWITLKDVIQHSFKEALGALADKVSMMARQCVWVFDQNKGRTNDLALCNRLIDVRGASFAACGRCLRMPNIPIERTGLIQAAMILLPM